MADRHKFKLSEAQQRKLLRGVSVQLKPDALADGDTEIALPRTLATKVNRARRMGKGVRLKLSPQDIEMNGGSIGTSFKKAGRAIKKAGETAGKFLHKNRKNILKTVVKIAAPILLKGVAKYTGIPVDAATKQITDASLHGIDSSPALAKKKGPRNKTPVLDVAQAIAPQTPYLGEVKEMMENMDYDVADAGKNSNAVAGGKVLRRGGALMAAALMPVGGHRLIGAKTVRQRQGKGLYAAGQGLFAAGGGMLPARF